MPAAKKPQEPDAKGAYRDRNRLHGRGASRTSSCDFLTYGDFSVNEFLGHFGGVCVSVLTFPNPASYYSLCADSRFPLKIGSMNQSQLIMFTCLHTSVGYRWSSSARLEQKQYSLYTTAYLSSLLLRLAKLLAHRSLGVLLQNTPHRRRRPDRCVSRQLSRMQKGSSRRGRNRPRD